MPALPHNGDCETIGQSESDVLVDSTAMEPEEVARLVTMLACERVAPASAAS
jgi:hypothetical protein